MAVAGGFGWGSTFGSFVSAGLKIIIIKKKEAAKKNSVKLGNPPRVV